MTKAADKEVIEIAWTSAERQRSDYFVGFLDIREKLYSRYE